MARTKRTTRTSFGICSLFLVFGSLAGALPGVARADIPPLPVPPLPVPPPPVPQPAPEPPPKPVPPPKPLPSVEGTWAHERTVVSTIELPVAGLIKKSQRVRALWRIESVNGALRATETICSIQLTSSSAALSMKVGKGFVAAASGATYEVTFTRTRDQGDLFEASGQSIIGARLGRVDAPLPNKPEDPSVIDADGDGKPGVTVVVGGLVSGEIHLVRRSSLSLSGTAAPEGKSISGDGTTIFEQNIISTTNGLLASPAPESITETRFTMKRVKDGAKCPK